MSKFLVLAAVFVCLNVNAASDRGDFLLNNFVAGYTKLDTKAVEKTVETITNEQDKASYRNFLNSWRPKPGLVVINEPWHLKIYLRGKKKFEMTWLLVAPVAVHIDGKIVVLEKIYPSVTATMNALWTERYGKKSAAMSLLLPEAYAEGEVEFKKLALTYYISRFSIYGTAEHAFSDGGYVGSIRREMLPQLTRNERWTWKNLKCTDKGIDDQSFEFAGKKVTLSAESPFVYKVTGVLADGTPMRLTIKSSEREPARLDGSICGRQGISGDKDCDQFWKEFFAATPGASEKFVASGETAQNCEIFDRIEVVGGKIVEHFPCRTFLTEKYRQLKPNRKLVATDYLGNSVAQLVPCPNGKCADSDNRRWSEIGLAIEPSMADQDTAAVARTAEKVTALAAAEATAKRDKFIEILKANGIENPESHCTDQGCKIPTEAATWPTKVVGQLREALPANKPASDPLRRELLPSANLGIDMNNKVEKIGIGMLLLADCCNHAACKRALYKNYSINLQEPENPAPKSTQ